MTTICHERVDLARRGENPTVICRVESGWVVLADRQFLRGYSILLSDPVAPDLNALRTSARTSFLLDMAAIGDAILQVTDAYRINYSILGNTDPVLHAHICPRYRTEPDEQIGHPIWVYPESTKDAVPFDLPRDRPLMDAIRDALAEAGIGA